MLVLMRGSDVIEGEIAGEIERALDAVLLKNRADANAILLLRTDQKRSSVAKSAAILQCGNEECLGGTVAKTGGEDGERLIAEILLQNPYKVAVFGILSDTFV